MDLKAAFMTKVGPLPAVAWAGMAGVGYWFYAKKKANAGIVSTGAAAGTDPSTGYSTSGDLGSSQMNPGYSDAAGSYISGLNSGGSSSSNNPGNVDSTPLDNSSWGIQAANYLSALGIDPLEAQTAISNYLYGTGQLTTTQAAALKQALTHLGTPPGGVIAPPTVLPNNPTPTPTPPTPTQPNPTPPPVQVTPTATPTPVQPQGFTGPQGDVHIVIGESDANVKNVQDWFIRHNPYGLATQYHLRSTGVYDDASGLPDVVRQYIARSTGQAPTENAFGISAKDLAQ